MKKNINGLNTIWFVLIILLLITSITACQSAPTEDTPSLVVEDNEAAQSEQDSPDTPENETDNKPDESTPNTPEIEPEPVDVEGAWQSSPHADTFLVDDEGNNNTCARCHAPINWQPSLDDLPESCFTCKFEVDDPAPYIAEAEWEDIPCKVCHEADKKDVIQPEYAWLEIAALEEYAAVATPSELCMKCHDTTNVPEHGMVEVGGGHEGYECTQCHNAHDTTPASCDSVDCHANVIDPEIPIAGHDEDHKLVSCAACHDGAGMDVGPSEELGIWTTFAPWSYETTISETETSTETGVVAFTSHNLVLEASCERCHFADNPWSLSDNVEGP